MRSQTWQREQHVQHISYCLLLLWGSPGGFLQCSLLPVDAAACCCFTLHAHLFSRKTCHLVLRLFESRSLKVTKAFVAHIPERVFTSEHTDRTRAWCLTDKRQLSWGSDLWPSSHVTASFGLSFQIPTEPTQLKLNTHLSKQSSLNFPNNHSERVTVTFWKQIHYKLSPSFLHHFDILSDSWIKVFLMAVSTLLKWLWCLQAGSGWQTVQAHIIWNQ